MRINNNLMALNAHRYMSSANSKQSKSLEKLSSGLAINSAADNAAGLAISEKMRAQINGLDKATDNAQDGISMIQTAEGALQESENILQRMRELAVQSSNDTLEAEDRTAIQSEITALKDELDRIATDTEFNTKKLLDGSIKNSATIGTNASNMLTSEISNDSMTEGDYTVTVSGAAAAYTLETGGTSAVDSIATGTDDISAGEYTLELVANGSNWDATLNDASGTAVETLYDQTIDTSSVADTLDIGGIEFTWNSGTTVAEGSTDITVDVDATFSVADSDGNVVGAKTITDNTTSSVTVGGLDLTFDDTITNGDTTITVKTDAVNFQIGANEGQTTNLAIDGMLAEDLGIDDIDLTTAETASSAITALDSAITSVSEERANLGGVQNRLEHTINNLSTTSENLTASESRIRDVDMAKEMMEYTKLGILQQASQAMLAQANQAPQGVLQLLQ